MDDIDFTPLLWAGLIAGALFGGAVAGLTWLIVWLCR